MPNVRVTRLLVVTAALLLPLFIKSATPAEGGMGEGISGGRESFGPAGRDWRHELRVLGEAIYRIEDRSEGLVGRLDSELDGGPHDGSPLEDRINVTAKDFRRAARRLLNRYDELDYYRSRGDARELLRVAWRLDRLISGNVIGHRVKADWEFLGHDLRIVANAYNFDYGDARD